MNERETISIATPIEKHVVILKAWLTGREQRQIRSVLFEGVKFSASSPTEEKEEESSVSSDFSIDGSTIGKQQDIKINTIIVSINDKTDNILDLVLDMHGTDTEFIIKEVEKISNSLDESTKKK